MPEWSVENIGVLTLSPDETQARERVLARLIFKAALKRETMLRVNGSRGTIATQRDNGRKR